MCDLLGVDLIKTYVRCYNLSNCQRKLNDFCRILCWKTSKCPWYLFAILEENMFLWFQKSTERAVVKAEQLRNDIFYNVYFFAFSWLGLGNVAKIDQQTCFFTLFNSVLIVTPPFPKIPPQQHPAFFFPYQGYCPFRGYCVEQSKNHVRLSIRK